ncbi:MAG: mechanosensitive ion channel [Granulosicoccus sp.]|nr:mechanosensitive ion channel [Granulosicoccus sp.]
MFHNNYVTWSFVLVLVVPCLLIFLSEIIERLRRRDSKYTSTAVGTRDVVLPIMVVLMLLRFVFDFDENNLAIKIISTAFWIALIVLIYRLTRLILGKNNEASWHLYVPRMMLQLPPYTAIGLIVFHIVQNLWSLPLRELATTLGIGSIVIAFALQDTLSNLVSGLLLVVNSPFKTGEWVNIGDVEGKIVDVNWRYTSIETWNGDLLVIPNGSLSSESIENHSRPSSPTVIAQTLFFSCQHPPNEVKRMLVKTLNSTPGVLSDPPASAAVINLSDPKVEYEVEYWIEDYGDKPDIKDDFMTRVWYAARREQLDLPRRTLDLHTMVQPSTDESSSKQLQQISTVLDNFTQFSRLPDKLRTSIADQASLFDYSAGETIIEFNERSDTIYFVCEGVVNLWLRDSSGDIKKLEQLDSRGFFGEAGLTSLVMSPIRARAVSDVQVLVLSHETMNETINKNHRFAEDISNFVSRRRELQERIIGKQKSLQISNMPLGSIAGGKSQ